MVSSEKASSDVEVLVSSSKLFGDSGEVELITVDGSTGACSAFGDADPVTEAMTSAAKRTENRAESQLASRKRSRRKPRAPQSAITTVLVSGLGFLADAYDLFVIDFVVAILRRTSFETPTDNQVGLIASATLVGAVVGQLGFGMAADFMGRRSMFVATAVLCIFGSGVSALVGIGYQGSAQTFNVFYQLALVRFFLGVGIGGEYPLAATVASEVVKDSELPLDGKNEATPPSRGCWWYLSRRPNSVAAVFSMQGVGMMLSPLLVMAAVATRLPLEAVWRILLAVGVFPSLVAFYFRWRMAETSCFKNSRRPKLTLAQHLRRTGQQIGQFRKQLVGTAGTWFLIDVTFYGTGSFKSSITSHWFLPARSDSDVAVLSNLHDEIFTMAATSSVVALMAIPGYFLSVLFIHKMGLRWLTLMGFVAVTATFAALGGLQFASVHTPVVDLVLFGLTFLFTNFGPNTSTFILPTEVYPTSVRATCHGLSAAAGKAGAVVGTYLFSFLERSLGLGPLLLLCAVVTVLGALVAYFFISNDSEIKEHVRALEDAEKAARLAALSGAPATNAFAAKAVPIVVASPEPSVHRGNQTINHQQP